MDQSNYRGFFINLDRSVDRRDTMEARLRELGLSERYARFAAVESATLPSTENVTAAESACFHSHYLSLAGSKSLGSTIHIMEDDTLLVPQLEEMICVLDTSGLLEPFDIVFTESGIGAYVGQLRKYKQMFETYRRSPRPELSVLHFNEDYLFGSSSYLIPARATEKVLSVWRGGLDAGPSLPFDLFLRQEAHEGRLQVGCVFPFVTCHAIEDIRRSTIEGRESNLVDLIEIMSLLRYSFFLGRDLGNIPSALLGKLQAHDDDEHAQLIASVLRFAICSGGF